jgi:hypothetical protein
MATLALPGVTRVSDDELAVAGRREISARRG